MMNDTLEFLLHGIQLMHGDGDREEFLRDVWHHSAEIGNWQKETLPDRFDADSYPVFLHGGSSRNKIVVVGLNPGQDDVRDPVIEHELRKDADAYVRFHTDFYDLYPKYDLLGPRRSPYWSKLHSKLEALLPDVRIPNDKWDAYRELVVMQDLIPFHSKRQGTTIGDLSDGSVLCQLGEAVFDGIRLSEAREVWGFSREGFAAVNRWVATQALTNVRRSVVSGCTRANRTHRSVRALAASIDRHTAGLPPLPLLAVDNALVSQPTFPFSEITCTRPECEPRRTYAEQLVAVLAPFRKGVSVLPSPPRESKAAERDGLLPFVPEPLLNLRNRSGRRWSVMQAFVHGGSPDEILERAARFDERRSHELGKPGSKGIAGDRRYLLNEGDFYPRHLRDAGWMVKRSEDRWVVERPMEGAESE